MDWEARIYWRGVGVEEKEEEGGGGSGSFRRGSEPSDNLSSADEVCMTEVDQT